jgi:hypothetical protein
MSESPAAMNEYAKPLLTAREKLQETADALRRVGLDATAARVETAMLRAEEVLDELGLEF